MYRFTKIFKISYIKIALTATIIAIAIFNIAITSNLLKTFEIIYFIEIIIYNLSEAILVLVEAIKAFLSL